MNIAMADDPTEIERKRVAVAMAGSMALHALIILLIAFALGLKSSAPLVPVEEMPVELTLIAPPEPPKPSYVATSSSQEAAKPPSRADFESDKNTAAASELPASGDAPLPSQNGEEIPALALENKEYTAGPQARPSTPSAAGEPSPAPAPEAVPTPRTQAQLALLDPAPPRTQARPQVKEPPKEKAQAVPQTPGYQPQTRITRIRGNISNRGRSSVNASATPLGRYKKQLSDAIGSRWYYYVNDQIGLLNVGTLDVRFVVRESGKVERVEVVRNSSNESFAACSVRAIMEAEIPPIPQEIVPMLEGGRIEIEYSFTILSN